MLTSSTRSETLPSAGSAKTSKSIAHPRATYWAPRVTHQSPTRAGRRSIMPRETEIALACSAAPASVSRNARVLLFADTAFVVGASGSNGVTCIVNRSWPASLEPHCFDSEATATILPMELRRTILFHRLAEFIATLPARDSVVFENPAHDFPQRLIYRSVSSDSLHARIEGTIGGQQRSQLYAYRRLSWNPE